MGQDKILIVDNEMEMIQLIRLYLIREGYQVAWTTDSTKALEAVRHERPDLILLDVVMPGLSGIDLCGQIRLETEAPILFVSCKCGDMDKVLGLSIGGDDYIGKPFSPAELVARVKAHLRRTRLSLPAGTPGREESRLDFSGISIDLQSRTVVCRGHPVHLTAKEFDLLALLSRYPSRIFTPGQIFGSLWDSCGLDDDYRTVNVHIFNLRKKIEADPEHPRYIQTVRGVGYKFVAGPESVCKNIPASGQSDMTPGGLSENQ